MNKLIAIGGGQIGRPGYPMETLSIDREIIKLSGKKRPKLLFVPTASKDAHDYIETVKNYFGKKLGCKVDTLLTVGVKPTIALIKEKILKTDIVYVGGGNTLYMMNTWKKLGIDKILSQAYEKGAVISGLSAGAICWFQYGTSDSRIMTNPEFKDYIRVSGLGWYPLTLSPHHIREKKRKAGLIKLIKKHGGIGLAMDDYSALEIVGKRFRIICSKPEAKVHKVYIQNNKIVYSEMQKKIYSSLESLLEKS